MENKMLDFTKCEWEQRGDFAKLLVYQGAKNATIALGEMIPGGPHKAHSHIYEQIILVTSGHAHLHIGEEIADMTPGCIVAIPSNVIHMFEPIGDEKTYYIDIFSPRRPDHTGMWVDPEGVERMVAPKEERIQSAVAAEAEKRAHIPFIGYNSHDRH